MNTALPSPSNLGWYDDASRMLEALDQHARYNFKTRGEMLLALGRARGTTTRGLLRALDAAAFIQETYPQLLHEPVFGGFSVVNYLEKLHHLDPGKALEMAPEILKGNTSTSVVKNACKTIEAKPRTAARSIAKFRSLTFYRLCIDIVATDPARFCARKSDTLTVTKGYTEVTIPVSAAIFDKGKPVAAICPKVFGAGSSNNEVTTLLGTASLLLRRFKKAWILVPETAQTQAAELVRLAKIFELDDLMVGVINETTRELHRQR